MNHRPDEQPPATYIPPTPERVKPHGSADNSVEMAAGGEVERKTLAAQREKVAHTSEQQPVVLPLEDQEEGRADNSRGTGVGYGGAANVTYGGDEAVTDNVAVADARREDHNGNRS